MMVPGLLERPSQRHKHAATATLSLTSVSIVGGFNLAVITESYYSYHWPHHTITVALWRVIYKLRGNIELDLNKF